MKTKEKKCYIFKIIVTIIVIILLYIIVIILRYEYRLIIFNVYIRYTDLFLKELLLSSTFEHTFVV